MKFYRLAEVPSKKAMVPTKRDAARPARRKTNAETLIGTNSKAFVWRRYHICLNCERSFCFYTFVQTHSCTPSPRDSLCIKAVQQDSIPSKIEQTAWDMHLVSTKATPGGFLGLDGLGCSFLSSVCSRASDGLTNTFILNSIFGRYWANRKGCRACLYCRMRSRCRECCTVLVTHSWHGHNISLKVQILEPVASDAVKIVMPSLFANPTSWS